MSHSLLGYGKEKNINNKMKAQVKYESHCLHFLETSDSDFIFFVVFLLKRSVFKGIVSRVNLFLEIINELICIRTNSVQSTARR